MAQFALDGYAFITGGGSGIGREIGYVFAEAGARGVMFADLNATAAAKAAEDCEAFSNVPGFRAMSIEIDVTKSASVQNAVEFALKEFGALDYCINSAGVDVAAYVPFSATSENDYDRVLEVNAKGSFLVTQAVAKVMQKQELRSLTTKRHGTRAIGRGAIVNIASALAFGAIPARTAYIASKHALLGITRSAAMDLNRSGIRVNLVCPTWVDTPMYKEENRRVPLTTDLIKSVLAVGRPAETDEVATAVQYLCSPAAAYITGTSIMIDGGLSIGPSFGM